MCILFAYHNTITSCLHELTDYAGTTHLCLMGGCGHQYGLCFAMHDQVVEVVYVQIYWLCGKICF